MDKKILFEIINASNQEEVLDQIGKKLVESKISDKKNFNKIIAEFKAREAKDSTNLNEGFAIPHIISKNINSPAITIIRLKKLITWGDPKLKKISFIIAISLPAGQGKEHLKIISKLSSKLVDPAFVKIIQSQSKDKVISTITNVLSSSDTENSNKKSKVNSGSVKIMAITTCPTGIAHTHMAAESLIAAAKSMKIDIRVEKQAAEGVVNGLTDEEIKSADYCLFAIGKNIDRSRFVGKKCYEIAIAEAIKNPNKVLNDCQTKAQVYASGKLLDKGSNDGTKLRHANPIMNALMNGLSYMIPIIITGGILLAVSIGIGSAIYGNPASIPPTSFFGVIQQIGGTAFTIMIPVLGAYIAYAIGDKAAMAPAFILSLFCNTNTFVGKTNTIGFWNWTHMGFGHFDVNNPPVLGFFGAIAVGLLAGYIVKYMKKINWPKQIRSIVPIFIIPITTTLVLWAFIAFFGYLPLFYLSYWLKIGIEHLVKLNLFWLVGIILGAMIAFDMGGPINKVAFLIGSSFLPENGLLMGADAAAIGVPPLGLALGVLINNKVFKRKNETDNELAKTAAIIGCLGITEGAIPFVVKNPRLIIANVIGGMVAGGIAGALLISNSVSHGSLIVYLLGAIGHQPNVTDPLQSNYLYGLWYIFAIIIGSCITAGLAVALYKKPVDADKFASILD